MAPPFGGHAPYGVQTSVAQVNQLAPSAVPVLVHHLPQRGLGDRALPQHCPGMTTIYLNQDVFMARQINHRWGLFGLDGVMQSIADWPKRCQRRLATGQAQQGDQKCPTVKTPLTGR